MFLRHGIYNAGSSYNMEAAMLNNEKPWDDDIEIDPELWLHALLAMTADKKDKENSFEIFQKKPAWFPRRWS